MDTRRYGVPALVVENYREWRWSVAWRYAGNDSGRVTTWRLDHDGAPTRFLKVGPASDVPSLADEHARLQWALPLLPVPTVLEFGQVGDTQFLVTSALSGVDGTKPGPTAKPEATVSALAEGLRRLHDTPTYSCPFRLPIDDLAERALLHLNQWDPPRNPSDYRTRISRDEARAILSEPPAPDGDPVVCHGDYCAPNAMLASTELSEVTGFVDLGVLAVADRWWDIAIGAWSAAWNYGDEYEAVFFDAYGVAPDLERVRFFRVAYDLFA